MPYPGVRQWLEHGHRENLWNYVLIKDEGANIEIPECEWVILGAWHPFYQQLVPHLKKAGVKIAVAWSSSATEMEHAPSEIEAVNWLLQQDGLVDAWLALQPDLAPLFPNGIHLPAPVHLEARVTVPEQRGIGFYAPATLKKNIFAQLLAIRGLQRDPLFAVDAEKSVDVTLYHNLASHKPIMDAFGVRNVLEPWVESREEHLKRVASRHLHMAASHAESFCYGAMDACMMGVPVVGSPTIAWLPPTWRTLNPNSPQAIQDTAQWLLSAGGTRLLNLDVKARSVAEATAAKNNEAAAKAIEQLLNR